MTKASDKQPKKAQIEKFRDKARELGCDENEDFFKAALGKIARHKPVPKSKEKSS